MVRIGTDQGLLRDIPGISLCVIVLVGGRCGCPFAFVAGLGEEAANDAGGGPGAVGDLAVGESWRRSLTAVARRALARCS